MAIINDTRNLENTNFAQLPRKDDKSTLAQMTLDYPHHEVHDGNHFFFYGTNNLILNGSVIYFYMQQASGANYPHILIDFSSNGYCQVDFGTCATLEGNITTEFANNRFMSANVAELKHTGFTTGIPSVPSYFATHVIGRDGTPPSSGRGSFGSIGGQREEFILNSGVIYLLKFTALMDDVDVNLAVNFYEHADKY